MMLTPELVNRWRVIPRIAMLFYFSLVWKTSSWFMELATPTAEQAAFATGVVGAAAVWFGFYVNSGASLKELREARGELSTEPTKP